MSREIKFRAWDGKQMLYDDIIPSCGEEIVVLSEYDWTTRSAIVEQYTGLQDKNGKEIYEGDIVRVPYGYNYEVRQFKSGAWRIGRDDLCVWADSSEVIGNIHKNPELLGDEK